MTAIHGIDYRRRRRRTAPLLATVDSSRPLKARERAEADWYVEPPTAVEGLFDVQRFSGWVWDPACGRGTIPKVCEAKGLKVIATDLYDRGYGVPNIDFLTHQCLDEDPQVDNVICNPPFELAEAFLKRALQVARHKVAFLLRWSWAEGAKRRWVWDETPLAAIHPFARRVSMPPGNVATKAKGGAVCFAWWIWDHDHIGPPIVRRIERELT